MTSSSESKIADRKTLVDRIAALEKQTATAKRNAKSAKTEMKLAKQKFKDAKRAARKLKKATKALQAELLKLSKKKPSRKSTAGTPTKKRSQPATQAPLSSAAVEIAPAEPTV